MAYIGNQPTIGQYRKLDDISGSFNGSLTAFTMQVGSTNVSAGSVFQLLISLGGVIQNPGTDFTVSGSTITFTTAPAASLSFFGILMGQPLNTATPGDSTVTGAKIVDGTITGGKLAAAFNYDSGLLFLDDTNNRVGIGTTSPSNLLHLAGTGTDLTGLRIVNTQHQAAATSTAGLKFGITNSAGQRNCRIQAREEAVDSNAIALDFFTSNADAVDGETVKMTVLSSGNVGVGTTSPDEILTIRQDNGGGDGASIRLHNSSATVGSNNKLIFTSSTTATFQSAAIIATRTASGTTIAFESDGTNERLRIDESGDLGVGTASPNGRLDVRRDVNGDNPIFFRNMDTTSSSSNMTTTLNFNFNRTGGGLDLPAAQIRAGKEIEWQGAAANQDGFLSFFTTANETSAERVRLSSVGGFKVSSNNAARVSSNTNGSHELATDNNGNEALFVVNRNSTSPLGMQVWYATDINNTANPFITCFGSSTRRAEIRSNGGIANFQANDANLCDEREKKNIETLDSTWGCLKNWEVKKFHYNEDADTDDKRYGVIAQQVALHCPEVITDWVKQRAEDAVLDDDGNVVTPAKEEIVRMGVKEQQMYWMAIKALQEAQIRIETLETANASLEARLTALEGGN